MQTIEIILLIKHQLNCLTREKCQLNYYGEINVDQIKEY